MGMNDFVKTGIFVGAAFVALIAVLLARPASFNDMESDVGQELFPDFQDITAVGSLEIKRVDQNKNSVKQLKISREGGLWVIASHKNYPADAEDAEQRFRDAALSLMDVEVLDVASDNNNDHEIFGVLEPSTENAAGEGAGMVVIAEDQTGKKLASLILGKPVKGYPDQRFARKPGQPRVYTVRLDTEKLSTEFEDWIEDNLLDVNQSDIRNIVFRDYNFDVQNLGIQVLLNYEPRLEVSVAWDSEDFEWELDKLLRFRGRESYEDELGEDEELNTSNLDDLKTSLDELTIIDAESKPSGISADLVVDEELQNDPEVARSLQQRGFYVVRTENGRELFASNGEVNISTQDGVQYVLRFGDSAGIQEKDGETSLNRFLLATARLDKSQIPEPELETVPDEVTEEESGETEADADQPADEDEGDGETDYSSSESDDTDSTEAEEEGEEDEEESERDRIIKENQRKTDEYNDKIKEAEDRVAELNDRFGGWYYVISEDAYKKINLGQFDLIKEKDTAEEEGFGLDAFRKLQTDGIEAAEEDEENGEEPLN